MSLSPLEPQPRHTSYDVVIAGGAVMGSSAAWWLTQDTGFSGRVLVVEPDPTYAKSATALTGSCIRHQFSNEINVQISMFGTEFIQTFRDRFPDDNHVPDITLDETGYLIMAGVHGADVLRANHAIQKACGAATLLLEPHQIAERFPFFNTDDLALGSWNPQGEGWFDGDAIFKTWRRKARESGVEYITNSVSSLNRTTTGTGNRIESVTLATGDTIACGTAINAAGTGATALCATAGIRLPVEPRKRCTFIFECQGDVPKRTPLSFDQSGVYFRGESGRYIAAGTPTPDLTVDPRRLRSGLQSI